MKYAKKILIILLCFICINTFTFAIEDPDAYKPGDLDSTETEEVGIIIGNVLANIKVVGICISAIMLTIIGLKYILCSVEEKANYKENMFPYIVGCFLLASATTIPSIIYDLVSK